MIEFIIRFMKMSNMGDTTDENKRPKITEKLKKGDLTLISEITEVPLSTVQSILYGYRNAKTKRGRRVIEAAERLVESRQQIKEEMAE